MIRDVDVREISDGRFYRSSDLVRLDTGGCAGCSACCHGMQDRIILDPYDVFLLNAREGYSFEQLLAGPVGLRVADGLVLPHLKTDGPGNACRFLDESGRCSIHTARPGLCRLFPLGRYYEGEEFTYILQVGECDRTGAKVRISKWLGIPELARYEAYIRSWHAFIRKAARLADSSSEQMRSMICTRILKGLFACTWDLSESFYPQYEAAEAALRRELGIL